MSMENKKIRLIDGVFEPNEALRVLSGVINSKINYHKLEDFSNHIRFDGAILNSKKRIDELQGAQEELLDLIEFAKNNNKKIAVKSEIIIQLLE